MPSLRSSLQSAFNPSFTPQSHTIEAPDIQSLIKTLHLQVHPEGGFFVETDRDPLRVSNPFTPNSDSDPTRNSSTTIFYLLTPGSPQGRFHRNKGRTVHTLHRGRGRCVMIHPPNVDGEDGGKGRIETFVVGQDLAHGERLQWIVEGQKWKASFLLPDVDDRDSGGLLISETVVPGFEFTDHDFLSTEKFLELVTEEQARELSWLLREV